MSAFTHAVYRHTTSSIISGGIICNRFTTIILFHLKSTLVFFYTKKYLYISCFNSVNVYKTFAVYLD